MMGAPSTLDLQAIPLARRARALSHLGTAYAILLANHGQASTLLARKTMDAGSGPLIPDLSINMFRDPTHEQSMHVASRFVEAQQFLQHALDELGVPRPEPQMIKAIGTAEQYFDSMLLDLAAAWRARNNLQANTSLADHVRTAYDAVRASDPSLAAAKPLESLANEPGQELIDGMGEVLGFAGGSPRFWSTGKWVMVIGMAVIGVAMVVLLVYAAATAPRE